MMVGGRFKVVNQDRPRPVDNAAITTAVPRKPLLILLTLLAITASGAPSAPAAGGSGYANPVLYADYSDPDVIRVGSKY
jgi:hypothetical protein